MSDKYKLDMSVSFTLTKEEIDVILKDQKVSKKVLFSIGDRKSAIEKKAKQKQIVKDVFLSQDERLVINHWNTHPYIIRAKTSFIEGSRNLPIKSSDVRSNMSIIKKAVRELGVEEIVNSIETYFESCEKGKHIWDNKSHGYKNLVGFLKKLVEIRKSGTHTWWESGKEELLPIEDDNEELTKKTANIYGRVILNQRRYRLENPSKDYVHFKKIGKNAWDLFESQILPYSDIDDMLKAVMDGAKASMGGSQIISPGFISRQEFWTNSFVQYLNLSFPGSIDSDAIGEILEE